MRKLKVREYNTSQFHIAGKNPGFSDMKAKVFQYETILMIPSHV